ncbi:MAG: alpha/beta hydrolase [Bacteroidota bacterium]
MKKYYLFFAIVLFFLTPLFAQEMRLAKGKIIDSLPVHDSIPETFSLYLPSTFDTSKKWPVVFVSDLKGQARQALAMFIQAAEKEGYVLAASNNLIDTVSLSDNMLATSRMIKKVTELLPIQKNRVYAAGFSGGGRFASLIPIFIKDIEGILLCGVSIVNTELLNTKNRFHFIGIVGKKDFNYTELLAMEELLDKLKFPHQILVFDGGNAWPNTSYLERALGFFTIEAMAKGNAIKDSSYIDGSYLKDVERVADFRGGGELLMANQLMGEIISVYGAHRNVDSIKYARRNLKKTKLFKSLRRNENNTFFKESLLKEDYNFYLAEDILTYNLNNLGWWNYQMTEINRYIYGDSGLEKEMGHRLYGYVNALVDDNIDVAIAARPIDEEALAFLWMLKTIIAPKNFDYYLKVISLSAKNEDFGTALFYLEEVLKKGFKDKKKLYALKHTALFRITPEFNRIIKKYLEDARYEINEE